jgi:TolA-binding protein
MLDPFVDTTQKELREAWKRIEELEKENKRLQEELDWYKEQEELEKDLWGCG